jgi:N-methylhydantoinase A
VRIAIDIGGTFTDFVAYDEVAGEYATTKLPTTPEDPSRAVLEGMKALSRSMERLGFVVHGTTVGLNAFLQRRGERVLLISTAGVGDLYHIARGNRMSMYNVHYRKPTPLVAMRDIVEVRGRLDFAGNELEPLDEGDVELAIERVRNEDFGAVAVAFLFSYVNSAHELRVAEMFAESLPDVSVSLSHRVAREWREYERTSSAVLDAYIAPTVRRYLGRFEQEARTRGLESDIHVMQSSGGILTARAARDRPLQTLLSGPVGGAMGGAGLARILERPNLICIDMGGTSFDVSLIADERPDVAPEVLLEGLPILMPSVNIHTIGAGGGSLAYEEAGGLRVGPESAGAVPGPACYGRGGTDPTVTDANVVLGRIDPSYFLGGGMSIDKDAADRSMDGLAEKLGLEKRKLAEGILDVINLKMAQAIRKLTVERGIEPRDFALVAFGGAGPMHAAFLAHELEIDEVIVPPAPGAFSAWGMLQTAIRHDLSQTYYAAAEGADLEQLDNSYVLLETEARDLLHAEGIGDRDIRMERLIDLRYIGQEHALQIALSPDEIRDGTFVEDVSERFHSAHEARHGHANRGAPVEFVAIRLVGIGEIERAESRPLTDRPEGAPTEHRRTAVFGGRDQDTSVVYRADIVPGSPVHGPAIVEEPTTTTVVPPGFIASVEPRGSLVLARKES